MGIDKPYYSCYILCNKGENMKYNTKKPLRKVYLCKDETMKEGDILLQFDRPFNFYLSQALWNKSLDKFELPFKKQLLYKKFR